MNPQQAEAWTLVLLGAAVGLAAAWVLRTVFGVVRRATGSALDGVPPRTTGTAGLHNEELERQNARLERERETERERRRILSDMNEMLLLQKEEQEARASDLAVANAELERMQQLTAWQQEALAERNEALENQTAEAERLSRELARRVEQLNAALAQIERLHRDHEAFLRHELRNAISPILGYVALLESDDPSSEQSTRWLAGIREAAEATERLLNELRDLQAIERGSRAIVRQVVPLDDLARSAVRAVDPRGTVEFDLDLATCSALGDPSLLPGVLVNLVRNAVEHVRGQPKPSVHVHTSVEHDQAIVRVRNGGPAIPKALLPRFFDRFNSTKEGGTGLGTSYVFLVVRAHGGDVHVESSDSTGTTVTVRLPLAGPDER